jgi:DNA polymerase-3 subunit beta
MPANEYPVRQPVDETAGLTFAAADLATALGIVGPNIPGEDNRYGLSGIHMELYDGRARFVATDGNRLAWAEAPAVGTMDLPRQSLIGRAGVVALANLLGTANLTGTDVIFAPGGKYIEIRTDVGTMHAQFITADFPDYRQVLPGKLGTTMTANRLDLLRAIDRVLPFAGGTIPEVLLTLPDGDAGESELTMTTSKLDSGNSLVTLAIEATGPAMKVNLNGKYLRDALITMDCDEVTLGFSGILSPAIVVPKGTPTTGGKSARINIIMPVRAS